MRSKAAREIFNDLHNDIRALVEDAHQQILALLTDEQLAILEDLTTGLLDTSGSSARAGRGPGFGFPPGRGPDGLGPPGHQPWGKRFAEALDLTEEQQAAIAEIRAWTPDVHLLLAGAPDPALELDWRIADLGLAGAVTRVESLDDEAFDRAIAACDIGLNLRWPSARETSGPWVRCLALGKPTIIIDLEHQTHVPSINPRTWRVRPPAESDADAVTVATMDCMLIGVEKPAGVGPIATVLVPPLAGSNWKPDEVLGVQFWLPVSVCGVFTSVPTPVFEFVIDRLTVPMPMRSVEIATAASVDGLSWYAQTRTVVFGSSVVVEKLPGLAIAKPLGTSVYVAEPSA